jgi:hypothetical protein
VAGPQDNIVDQILDDYLANQAKPEIVPFTGASSGTGSKFDPINQQILSDYGYQRQFIGPRGGQNIGAQQDAFNRAILADDPRALQNYQLADPETLSQYTGVDLEQGPTPGRAIRDLTFLPDAIKLDPEKGPDSVTRILQDNYREAGVDFPPDFDWNVRTDPTMDNQFIFNDPVTGSVRPVNPPGMNLEDIKAFSTPLAAEILPAIGTMALTKNVPASIVAEAGGHYLWRKNNLEFQKEKGYIPDNYPVDAQAMKDAGWVAAFGTGAAGAYKLYRFLNKLDSPAVPLDKEAFMEAYEGLQKEGIVDPNMLTSPQVIMAGGGEDVSAMGLEAFLRNQAGKGDNKYGRLLSQKYRDQEEKFVTIVDNLVNDFGISREQADAMTSQYLRKESGEDIQTVVRTDISELQEPFEQEIANLSTQADNILTDLTAGRVSPQEAGLAIRNTAVTAKALNRSKFDEAFEDAYKMAGFKGNAKPFDYSSLVPLLDRAMKKEGERALPNTNLMGTFNLIKGQIDSARNAKFSFDSFTKDLRSIQGEINKLANMGGEYGELVTLRDELVEIRKNALQNKNPKALERYQEGEELFKQNRAEFDNDIIQRITATQQSSSDLFKMGDKEAFNSLVTVLRNNVDTSYLNKIIDDPENTGAFYGIRDGLRGDFYSKVVNDTNPDGLLRPKGGNQYNRWMGENETLLKRFFNEDELAEFTSPENFINRFNDNIKQQELLKEAVANNNTLRGVVKSDTPETIFDSTWSKDNITPTMELKEVLERQGRTDLLDNYKAYIANNLIKNTSSKSRLVLGEKTFNGQKLIDYAENYNDQLTEWYGRPFVNGLTKIGQKLRSFDDISVAEMSMPRKLLFQALNQGARTYVGLFTTAGRMLTTLKIAKFGLEQSRFLNLLTNPEELANAISRAPTYNHPLTKLIVRATGREGMEAYTDDETPRSPVTTEGLMMLGPGAQQDEEALKTLYNRGGHVMKTLTVPLKYGFSK